MRGCQYLELKSNHSRKLTDRPTDAISKNGFGGKKIKMMDFYGKNRELYPDKEGNIRDYASINELICLSNMENINAVLIEDGLSQKERLTKLNKIAIHQMSILEEQNLRILK